MSLTAADIAEIARLLDESKFSSLTLETGGMKLRIRRDGGGWSAPAEEPVEAVAPSPAADEPPPALGQHTSEVLTHILGRSEYEIAALKSSGAI